MYLCVVLRLADALTNRRITNDFLVRPRHINIHNPNEFWASPQAEVTQRHQDYADAVEPSVLSEILLFRESPRENPSETTVVVAAGCVFVPIFHARMCGEEFANDEPTGSESLTISLTIVFEARTELTPPLSISSGSEIWPLASSRDLMSAQRGGFVRKSIA